MSAIDAVFFFFRKYEILVRQHLDAGLYNVLSKVILILINNPKTDTLSIYGIILSFRNTNYFLIKKISGMIECLK